MKTQPPAADYKYWAFISYSSKDRAWAKWLHSVLEGYRLPTRILKHTTPLNEAMPNRVKPVFWDRAELTAHHDLGELIEDGLRKSRYLIVICSRQAAGSHWVDKEIRTFLRMHGRDRIMAVIVDGEPNGQDGTTCFPPALRTWEPKAPDARPQGDGKTNVKLMLLAAMLGLPFDALKRRDQERKMKILAYSLAAALVMVATVGWLAWTAVAERDKANNARIAEASAKEKAEKRVLEAAVKAWGMARDSFDSIKDPRTGFAHLADALRYSESLPENLRVKVLRQEAALRLLGHPCAFPLPVAELRHDSQIGGASFSPDGKLVVTVDEEEARIWDAETGRELGKRIPARWGGFGRVEFSPNGQYFLTSGSKAAQIWDTVTRQPVGAPMMHSESMTCAKLSPDGERVATGSHDGTARLWDAATGKQVGEPLAHRFGVLDVFFSPDGQFLVTCGFGPEAKIWETKTGRSAGEPLRHTGKVWSIHFSPDGQRAVTCADDENQLMGAQMWDMKTRKQIGMLIPNESNGEAVNFSPDGARIVTRTGLNSASLWNGTTGGVIGRSMVHEDRLQTAQFSPDGLRLVTAGWDRTARIWDTATGLQVGLALQHDEPLDKAVFSPDGRRILTISNGEKNYCAFIWNLSAGNQHGEAIRHGYEVSSGDFSQDGSRMLIGSGSDAVVLDAETLRPLGSPIRHRGSVENVAYSPDDKLILTTCSDRKAWVWSASNNKPVGNSIDGAVNARFSADGSRIVISGGLAAQVWMTGPLRFAGELGKDEGLNYAASFSPDGSRVVTAGASLAVLRDATTGKGLGIPFIHRGFVSSVAFSNDGLTVLSGCRDGTAQIWNCATQTATGKPISHGSEVAVAIFSPDNHMIAVGGGESARLWDLKRRKPLGEPMGHQGIKPNNDSPSIGQPFGPHVEHATFRPDGLVLLTTSRGGDNAARLWDLMPSEVNPQPSDLIHWAGRMVNVEGQITEISQAERGEWRTLLLVPVQEAPNEWRRLLRWCVENPFTRTVTFRSRTRVPDYITREITWAMDHVPQLADDNGLLTTAYALDPGHPLIHFALAALESDPIRRHHLINFGRKRLAFESSPVLHAKAAAILWSQKEKTVAGEVFSQLVGAFDPAQTTWGSPQWISKLETHEWPDSFRAALIALIEEKL